MRTPYLLIILTLFIFVSCKKKESDNAYDDWQTNPRQPVMPDKNVDPNSIAGLHKNIFKPTCSNSGCHDGNFEPDFRTIESTYNSLVNRNTNNPDPNNPQYALRVVAGNASKSMILHRLSTFIQGTQGIMPLTTDPGSDWPSKKAEYIQNITNWINDGAKDQFGNSPSDIDFSPQMAGMIAYTDASGTPLSRSGFNPIEIPGGTTTLKIMFAFNDDKTAVNAFGQGTVNFSLNPNSYDSTENNLLTESSPVSANGIQGATVNYWHSITVNITDLGVSGDVIWIRTEVDDLVNPKIYIPGKGTSFNQIKYFAIRIN